MSHRVLQLAILVAGLGIALSDDGEASPSPSPSLDGDDDDGLPSCWNPLIGSMCVGGRGPIGILVFFLIWNAMMQAFMSKFCGKLCCERRCAPDLGLICPHWIVGIGLPFLFGGAVLASVAITPYFCACALYRARMDEPSCWSTTRRSRGDAPHEGMTPSARVNLADAEPANAGAIDLTDLEPGVVVAQPRPVVAGTVVSGQPQPAVVAGRVVGAGGGAGGGASPDDVVLGRVVNAGSRPVESV